jgi:hypothetical protein
LIQEKHTTENIDSRNCLLGVKNCTLIVGHRLFQQIGQNPNTSRMPACQLPPAADMRVKRLCAKTCTGADFGPLT